MLRPWGWLPLIAQAATAEREIERCYRCLNRYDRGLLTRLVMPCGCEEGFCSDCCRPDLGSWLNFAAGRCIKGVDRAIDLAA